MKIYVSLVQYLYDSDIQMSTHLTKKGALMAAIERMTEDLCSGIDEDEMEDALTAYDHARATYRRIIEESDIP